MKTIAFAAAVAVATLAVSATATPAFAQPHGKLGQARVTYDQKTDRYCFQDAVTGSRIPVVQCRSKADWAQSGVTIRHEPAARLAQR